MSSNILRFRASGALIARLDHIAARESARNLTKVGRSTIIRAAINEYAERHHLGATSCTLAEDRRR